MHVCLHEFDNKENYLMNYKGVRVAFHRTEWMDGSLYLHLDDKCVGCLDESSEALCEFEKSEFVIDNCLAD